MAIDCIELLKKVFRKLKHEEPRDALYFEDTGYLNFIIFKNGYSTLGNVLIYKKENRFIIDGIHSSVRPYKKSFKQVYKPNKTTSFIVYRKPYERFISLYKDIMSNDVNHQVVLEKYGLSRSEIKQNPLSFLKILEFQGIHDAHVMSQTECIERGNLSFSMIDLIVPIEQLSEFISKELHVSLEQVPHTNASKNIDASMFEPYREKIEAYFKKDLSIPLQYGHKFYKRKDLESSLE